MTNYGHHGKKYHNKVMAHVTFDPMAARQFDALPKKIKGRMVKIIERLSHWPTVSGAKPLKGSLTGHYRVRTGDYRLQFRIEADEVIVERVGHRDRFYED